jgi:hypothetical protein
MCATISDCRKINFSKFMKLMPSIIKLCLAKNLRQMPALADSLKAIVRQVARAEAPVAPVVAPVVAWVVPAEVAPADMVAQAKWAIHVVA